jgi:hypothetical protein
MRYIIQEWNRREDEWYDIAMTVHLSYARQIKMNLDEYTDKIRIVERLISTEII